MKKLILFFIILFINIDVSADIIKGETLEYIDDLYISIKKDNDIYFYSFDNFKFVPYNKTLEKQELNNEYYTNIIKNGFPNKNITGENKKDYYITQVALFLLNDYLNNINDDQNGILSKEIKQSNNEIILKSKELLNKSINDDINLSITEFDDYLKLKLINNEDVLSFTYDNINYNKDDEFIVDKKDSIDINLKYLKNKIYCYTYNDDFQKLISSKITNEETKVNKTFILNKTVDSLINKYKVTINNFDFNKNKINNSIFAIKDNNKIIDTINLNLNNTVYLDSGNYYLEQISIDKKYILYKNIINFKVNNDINLNIFNEIKKTKILVGFIKNNKYIKNINLTIKDYEGNIIKKIKTKNKLLNLDLNTGIYTITDESNNSFNFKVNQDGNTSLIKLGENLKTKIPNLKNIKNNNLYLGIFILISGIGIIVYAKIW